MSPILLTALLLLCFIAFLRVQYKLLHQKPSYSCSCYCPGCQHDLCRTQGVGMEYDAEGFVCYVCTCGEKSKWNFDHPVPIFIESTSRPRDAIRSSG